MSDNQGGPWGQFDNDDNKSSRQDNGGYEGPRQRPGGQRPNGPDIDELIDQLAKQFRSLFSGGEKRNIGLIALVVFTLYLLSGVFKVLPEQQGVITRFGKWVRTAEEGLHYHLPYPFESVQKISVTRENRLEVGFRSTRGGSVSDVEEESLMLTGDENILDIDFAVTWKIQDAGKFLFKVRDPEEAVRMAAQSVMRETIGQSTAQIARNEGRAQIQQEVLTKLQTVLDSYDAGIQVVRVEITKALPPQAVMDAFNDVQRARTDLERLRNEAEAYRNDIIPKARGDVQKALQDAEAYKQGVVSKATGDAARFMSVYNEYKQAKDVTAQRMYLETMEEILANANKIILDKNASKSGVLPYMPLDLKKPAKIEEVVEGN